MSEQDYEQLTLFQEDSHVSRSPWLVSVRDGRISAIYGLKCCELSESLRRVGLSVRTYLESCELPPGTWSRIWSVKAMTSRCLILKLRLSARCTGGSGSRLWPTIRAVEKSDYQYSHRVNGKSKEKTLTLQGAVKLWPTPRASDYKGCGPVGSSSAEHFLERSYLSGAVLYATPNARDRKNATAKEWDNPKNTRNLNRQIAKLYEGEDSTEARNGQLNPTWVEWLMGYPIGWTESDV